MNEKNYTTKELGLLLEGLSDKLSEFMKDNNCRHDSMLTTLQEHNGRLRKSEEWKAYITGAMVVISLVVGSFLIPIFFKVVSISPNVEAVQVNQ